MALLVNRPEVSNYSLLLAVTILLLCDKPTKSRYGTVPIRPWCCFQCLCVFICWVVTHEYPWSTFIINMIELALLYPKHLVSHHVLVWQGQEVLCCAWMGVHDSLHSLWMLLITRFNALYRSHNSKFHILSIIRVLRRKACLVGGPLCSVSSLLIHDTLLNIMDLLSEDHERPRLQIMGLEERVISMERNAPWSRSAAICSTLSMNSAEL